MVEENYLIPFESELHCRNLIVVYDSNTSSLQENGKFLERISHDDSHHLIIAFQRLGNEISQFVNRKWLQIFG